MTYKEKYLEDHPDKIDDIENVIICNCPHYFYPEVKKINRLCCSIIGCRQCWEKEVMNSDEARKRMKLMAQIACMNKAELSRIEESMHDGYGPGGGRCNC